MVGAVDWANLGVAAAFVLGAALGTIATLRIVKHVTEYYARQRRDD